MINSIFPLKECELFNGLDDDELARVAIICSEIELTEGTPLFSEHQPAERIYVVTKGQIALHKSIATFQAQPTRRFATVAFCAPGQVVGWSTCRTVPIHSVGDGLGTLSTPGNKFRPAP